MIDTFRRLLIRIGKFLPFVLCGIVFFSYSENVIALYNQDYLYFDRYIVLNTKFSFIIADSFEYDLLTIFAAGVLSNALSTCIYNKLAVLYLLVHLAEKKFFITVELYPEYIYAICVANIIICTFLCYKGLKQLL